MTGILQLMEKKGYIVRVSVPTDARLKQILLTNQGEDLYYDFGIISRPWKNCWCRE